MEFSTFFFDGFPYKTSLKNVYRIYRGTKIQNSEKYAFNRMHFKHHFFFEMWKMPGSRPPQMWIFFFFLTGSLTLYQNDLILIISEISEILPVPHCWHCYAISLGTEGSVARTASSRTDTK